MFLSILSFIIAFLLMGYSFLRYRHLWQRGRIPIWVYYVFQVIMIGALFVCSKELILISNEMAVNIVQILVSIYMGIMLYTPVFCFLRGIVRYIGKRRDSHSAIYRFMNHPAKSIYIILGITIVIGIFSVYNMRHIVETDYAVTISKGTAQKKIRIALISDMHIGSAIVRKQIPTLIAQVNQLKPDLIVLCGDIFDENTTESLKKYTMEQMKALQSEYGTFFVEGDHEVNMSDFEQYFTGAGITVLKDQTARLTNGIQLVGCRDESDSEKEDLSFLLSNVDKSKPLIVLSHQPKRLQEFSQMGVDVALCGHTEGGRDFLGFVPAFFKNDMIYGNKKIDTMSAITTSGAGGYGIPVKLIAPSEIALLTIDFK